MLKKNHIFSLMRGGGGGCTMNTFFLQKEGRSGFVVI